MARKKKEEEKAPTGPKVRFEEALETLEAIVRRLDGPEMPLEEALAEYEKGLDALKLCRGILDSAERKLEILVGEKDGKAETAEFPSEGIEKPVPRGRAKKNSPPAYRPASNEEDFSGEEEEDEDEGEESGPKDGFLF